MRSRNCKSLDPSQSVAADYLRSLDPKSGLDEKQPDSSRQDGPDLSPGSSHSALGLCDDIGAQSEHPNRTSRCPIADPRLRGLSAGCERAPYR
jgi:hypothetical protein